MRRPAGMHLISSNGGAEGEGRVIRTATVSLGRKTAGKRRTRQRRSISCSSGADATNTTTTTSSAAGIDTDGGLGMASARGRSTSPSPTMLAAAGRRRGSTHSISSSSTVQSATSGSSTGTAANVTIGAGSASTASSAGTSTASTSTLTVPGAGVVVEDAGGCSDASSVVASDSGVVAGASPRHSPRSRRLRAKGSKKLKNLFALGRRSSMPAGDLEKTSVAFAKCRSLDRASSYVSEPAREAVYHDGNGNGNGKGGGTTAGAAAGQSKQAMVLIDERTPELEATGLPPRRIAMREVGRPAELDGLLALYCRPLRKFAVMFGIGHLLLGLATGLAFFAVSPAGAITWGGDTAAASYTQQAWEAVLLGLSVLFGTYGSGPTVAPGHAVPFLLLQAASYLTWFLRVFMIGVFVVRFRTPARVSFSKWCVITSHSLTGLRSLEFRILNDRGLSKVVLQASVSVVLAVQRGGTRRFHHLKLVNAEQPQMPGVWTVSHIIDSTSPLYAFALDPQELVRQFASLSIVFAGNDPTTMEEVLASHVYEANQIVSGGHFAPMVQHTVLPDGASDVLIDYGKFQHVFATRPQPQAEPRRGSIGAGAAAGKSK